jgi:hypothetical protein
VKVNIYDRRTKKGTLEYYLAAFVDEKVIALKHVDFSSMPDMKTEDVARELEGFVTMFKEEISEGLIVERPDEQVSSEQESRKHIKK